MGSDVVLAGVQPRYLLPLIWLLAAVALVGEPYALIRFSSLQLGVAVLALSLAHAVALHVQIRRYVTGQDVDAFDLNAQAEWWWDLPVPPMGVWIAGSLAFLVATLLVAALVRAGDGRRHVGPATE
jgi:hypothetical protein